MLKSFLAWAPTLYLSLLFGCGQTSPPSFAIKEKIDPANDVSRLGVPIHFTHDPDQLPRAGSSQSSVWSGNWWPLADGGTTAAMRKYDQATQNGNLAEIWEQNTVSKSGSVSWAGHCNGLAAAGINEDPPLRAVEYQGQKFSIEDVQALLIEKWQGVSRVSLVGRRCQTTPVTDEFGRTTLPGCRDINPGSFHVLLGNMLGLHQKPFIIDISSDEQVWNYPVVSYRTSLEVIDENAAKQLTNISHASGYLWNLEAEQFMKVKTELRLATGKSLRLDYILEGRGDRIIGGEWIAESRLNHPDFAWTRSTPDPVNPFLDLSIIDQIAQLSR